MEKSALSDEIKKSYRKLVAKYHPDRNHGASAADAAKNEARVKSVILAYNLLNDPVKRAQFDEESSRRSRSGPPGPQSTQRNQNSSAYSQQQQASTETEARQKKARAQKEWEEQHKAERARKDQEFQEKQREEQDRAWQRQAEEERKRREETAEQREERKQKEERARQEHEREQKKQEAKKAEEEAERKRQEAIRLNAAPEGWLSHVSGPWYRDLSPEKNILRAILDNSRPNAQEFLLGLLRKWNWESAKVRSEFTTFANEKIIKLHEFYPSDPLETLERNIKAVEGLFAIPQTTLFPELMDALLDSRYPELAISRILTLQEWKTHAQLDRWLDIAIKKNFSFVIKALIHDFFPAVGADSKKQILRKMISTGTMDSLQVIAETLPISENGTDFSSEIALLSKHGDDIIRANLASRFQQLLSSKLTMPAPPEYYKLALELNPYLSKKLSPRKLFVDPNHSANKDATYTSAPPKDWKKFNSYWNQNFYVDNILIGLFSSFDQRSMEYNLDQTRGMDWSSPTGPAAQAFAKIAARLFSEKSSVSISTKFLRRPMVLFISLPMSHYFPELVRKWDFSPKYGRDEVAVFAIEEMAKQAHWLGSEQLPEWIRNFQDLKSNRVDDALNTKLFPALRRAGHQGLYQDQRSKPRSGPAMACEKLF